MRPRILVLAIAFALLAPAPAALAQNPFGVPSPEPTIEPVPGAEDDVSTTTLYLIAAGVLIGVVALGYAISRDARRSLTEDDREALEREERGERQAGAKGSKEARARAKKRRAKDKAARKARRHNR